MKIIGKILKFLFPAFINRLIYLDELLCDIIGLKIMYSHSGLYSDFCRLNNKIKLYNDNRMWFMHEEKMR